MESNKEEGVQLEELPREVLAMIFGFVPTKELYPSCFLLSSTCLAAVLEETVWRARCERDLGVLNITEEQPSWFHHYRDSCLAWDPKEGATKHLADRLSFPSPSLLVWPQGAEPSAYLTIRSKQSFSSGIVALEFHIEKCNDYIWSVGFIDDGFDPCRREFADHAEQSQVCYSWGNNRSASHSVLGRPTSFSGTRRVCQWWKGGQVVGALLDFARREIQYFLDGQWAETVPLHPQSKRLWPMANIYNSGVAVRLRMKSVGSVPSDWQRNEGV
ncbi:hypothetical protein QOT17_001943 [Balamuthia mandrillaris]